jgi:hypothetical protein
MHGGRNVLRLPAALDLVSKKNLIEHHCDCGVRYSNGNMSSGNELLDGPPGSQHRVSLFDDVAK